MSDKNQSQNQDRQGRRVDETEVADLRRHYRAIAAPPELAARIRAHTTERPGTRSGWQYAFAVAAVVMCVIWLLPAGDEEPVIMASAKPKTPSLLSVGRIMPPTPTLIVPSTTRIKTFKRPALPSASQFATRNKT